MILHEIKMKPVKYVRKLLQITTHARYLGTHNLPDRGTCCIQHKEFHGFETWAVTELNTT